MPLTTLDPVTALIVVDLQKGIVGNASLQAIAEIIERNRALLRAFRTHNLPVALVNVAGIAPGRTERPRPPLSFPAGWTDLIPELDAQSSDILITKHTWGAFTHTELETRLRTLNVTQVVVTGVATGTGVEATARQAYEAGFHVTLATDAMTDPRPEAQAYSFHHVFPRLGESGTTQEILALLSTRTSL